MTERRFTGIRELHVTGDCDIGHEGLFRVKDGTVKRDGNRLIIESGQGGVQNIQINNGVVSNSVVGGRGVSMFNFGGIGSINGAFNGGTSMCTINGVMTLTGDPSTPISINGVKSTMGGFVALHDLMQGKKPSTPAVEQKPKVETCYLEGDCSIRRIICCQSGTTYVHRNFLSDNCQIDVSGHSCMALSSKEFASLAIIADGHGKVEKVTDDVYVNMCTISTCGHASVTGLVVTGTSSITASGHSSVVIDAEYPERVGKLANGFATVRINLSTPRQPKVEKAVASAPPPSTTTASTSSAPRSRLTDAAAELREVVAIANNLEEEHDEHGEYVPSSEPAKRKREK